MKKWIFTIMLALFPFTTASAQLIEMVFGPLEGDSAGVLYVDTGQIIDVDLWIRTAPGISILSFHIPLSSEDLYVESDSREGGEISDILYYWDDIGFLSPNPDPVHGGYTNQSLMGIEFIEPRCENGIQTEGEWLWLASFRMTTVQDAPIGVPLCNVLIEGYHPDNQSLTIGGCIYGDVVLFDPSDIDIHLACFWFVPCGYYVVGDYNGSGAFNVADIVDSYSRLKTGLPEPASICECPPESGVFWAVAADVNNSCAFNVADVVDGYSFLKTGQPEPSPCELCPPGEP